MRSSQKSFRSFQPETSRRNHPPRRFIHFNEIFAIIFDNHLPSLGAKLILPSEFPMSWSESKFLTVLSWWKIMNLSICQFRTFLVHCWCTSEWMVEEVPSSDEDLL